MIFSDSPQQRALERMMTAVPRFRPKGGGIIPIRLTFQRKICTRWASAGMTTSGSEKPSAGSKASSFCPTTTVPRSVNCTTDSASLTSPAPIRWHSGMKPERNSRSFSLLTTITTSAKTQSPSSSRCSTSTATRTTTTKKY